MCLESQTLGGKRIFLASDPSILAGQCFMGGGVLQFFLEHFIFSFCSALQRSEGAIFHYMMCMLLIQNLIVFGYSSTQQNDFGSHYSSNTICSNGKLILDKYQ